MYGTDQCNLPSFSGQSVEHLVNQLGCQNISELSGNSLHRPMPIYYYDNEATRNELKLRLQAATGGGDGGGGVVPTTTAIINNPWTPSNSFSFPQLLRETTLKPKVWHNYTPNTMMTPERGTAGLMVSSSCCSETCSTDEGVTMQMNCGDSCGCREDDMECSHAGDCSNTVIRTGVYPPIFICHTNDDNLKLGVKAGQDISLGSIIIPYIGDIYQGEEQDNGCLLDISDPAFTIVNNLYVNPVPNGGVAHFINDCGPTGEANVAYEIVQSCNSISPIIRAIQNITQGEWLSVEYGQKYWDSDANRINMKKTSQSSCHNRQHHKKEKEKKTDDNMEQKKKAEAAEMKLIVLRVYSSKLKEHLLIPAWQMVDYYNKNNSLGPSASKTDPSTSSDNLRRTPPPPIVIITKVRLLSDAGSYFPRQATTQLFVKNLDDIFEDPESALRSISPTSRFKGILISHFSQNLEAFASKWKNWNEIRIVSDLYFGHARIAAIAQETNNDWQMESYN